MTPASLGRLIRLAKFLINPPEEVRQKAPQTAVRTGRAILTGLADRRGVAAADPRPCRSSGDDVTVIAGDTGGISILGLATWVNIVGFETALDRLFGGAGDDVLIGGPGY